MKREEILAIAPGTELSMKVAEKVMRNVTAHDPIWGCMERVIDPADGSSVWIPLNAYSEDTSLAESVIEAMLAMGYKDAIYWASFGHGKYSEAEAICKAALLAVSEEPVSC